MIRMGVRGKYCKHLKCAQLKTLHGEFGEIFSCFSLIRSRDDRLGKFSQTVKALEAEFEGNHEAINWNGANE